MRELYLSYRGAVSAEEILSKETKQTNLSGIDNLTLQKVAKHASQAVGISEDAAKIIKNSIQESGLTIRSDEEGALDDWTTVLMTLDDVVSVVPFCARKYNITSEQFRNLARQMIIYLKSYQETGHVSADESQRKRTVPMSFGECVTLMLKLSWQVPFSFILTLFPRSMMQVNMTAVLGKAIEKFTYGMLFGDLEVAAFGFWLLIAVIGSMPILAFLANLVESRFTAKMINACRKKMLKVMLRGGTKFEEVHRNGKLIDTFSNQINQLEIFTMTFFVQLCPLIVGVIAGVWMAATVFPFASILFISFIPVVVSVDYFVVTAAKAAQKKVAKDGEFMGKISSAVESRSAIRVCNASSWIFSDLSPLLTDVEKYHRNGFYKSTRVENFTTATSAFYQLLIMIPVGLMVLDGKMTFDAFVALMQPLTQMMATIIMLGLTQNQVTLYSGAMQMVSDLMDDSLSEESSVASEQIVQLSPLSDSLAIKGVKFRYSQKLPDVIKDFSVSVGKGEYMVLMGGSGSGKSTVLNLLMRFREPYEGSIEWDGTNIYDSSFESFRDQVSVMFQKTMIYQATVRENILFGKPDVPGAVELAAQRAEIANFIEALPDGYDTVIGGDAIAGMSGGQLQRVCLARALYRNPSVLMLDEATSALDAKTEDEIIETLVKLRDDQGLTMVSVSHHPSTAVKADKIVVLDHGAVAEEGLYNELVSREGGIFRGLVEAGEADKGN